MKRRGGRVNPRPIKMMRLALFISILMITCGNPSLSALDNDDAMYGKIVKEIRTPDLRFTNRKTILHAMISKAGDPYLEKHAEDDLEQLERLGMFSAIDIDPVEKNDGIVLIVRVKEIFPYLPTPSMSISDETGVSLGGGLKSTNLLRREIFFAGAARFGGATELDFTARNPAIRNNRLIYDLRFLYLQRANDLDDFQEESAEFIGRAGTRIGENLAFGGQFQFLSLGSDTAGITLSEDNRDNIPAVGGFLRYDSLDALSDPRRGWWNEMVALRKNVLGHDGDYWTFIFDIRRYHSIWERHTIALFSLTTLQTGVVGIDIPVHEDFHIGGTNTVRGWGLDSRNGKNQFINTIEYRYTLMKLRTFGIKGINGYVGIQPAVFVDLGIAWNEGREFKTGNFIDGYGVGFRLLVPFVDLIRMDLGFGEPGEGLTFHFGILKKVDMQRQRVR